MAGAKKPRVLKVGSRVQARTTREKEMQPGVVTEVREGPTGNWYSVRRKDGSVINTRGSCIQ